MLSWWLLGCLSSATTAASIIGAGRIRLRWTWHSRSFFPLAVDLVRSFFSVSPVISFRFSGNLVCRRALEKIAVLFRFNSAATVGNRLVDCQTTRQYCKRVSIVATVNTLGLPSRVSPVWWFRVCCILLISAGMLCRLQSPSRPARYSQPGAWIL